MNNLDQLRFPVGKFNAPDTWTKEDLHQWIAEIVRSAWSDWDVDAAFV